MYDQPMELPARRHSQRNRHSNLNDYDDPDALQTSPTGQMIPTRDGIYDDVQDVISKLDNVMVNPFHTYLIPNSN